MAWRTSPSLSRSMPHPESRHLPALTPSWRSVSSAPLLWTASRSATDSSTAPKPGTTAKAPPPIKSASRRSRSSVAAKASGRGFTSTTPLTRQLRPSLRPPAFTTWSMMIPRRSASGCRHLRALSGRPIRRMSPKNRRSLRSAKSRSTTRRSSAAPPIRRRAGCCTSSHAACSGLAPDFASDCCRLEVALAAHLRSGDPVKVMPVPSLAPFRIAPFFSPRPWGTRDLSPWYDYRPAEPVGEAWLTGPQCLIETGDQQGRTLSELAAAYPGALLGPHRNEVGDYPLLIKILSPHEKLSVQVPPDDAMAQQSGEPRGKTECWYVLKAEPGASVELGLKPGTSIEAMRKAIADHTLEDKLQYVPVKAGDMVFVDANTVHAIGPGMTVLETQQYSDVT